MSNYEVYDEESWNLDGFGYFLGISLFSYFLSVNYKSIISKMSNFIMYSPGVGKTNIEKIGKKRYGMVESDLGTINLPVMKMGSFEYIYGFFEINDTYPLGVMELDKFKDLYNGKFPPHQLLYNLGDYLVLNYRRPSDFRGRHSLYGFVRSDIDDLILVFLVEDNQLIDYESIEANFVEAIETFQPEGTTTADAVEEMDPFKTTTFCEESDPLKTTAPTPDDYTTGTKSTEPEGYCCVGDVCVKKEEVVFRFDRDYRIDDERNNCLNPTETFTSIQKDEEKNNIKIKEL